MDWQFGHFWMFKKIVLFGWPFSFFGPGNPGWMEHIFLTFLLKKVKFRKYFLIRISHNITFILVRYLAERDRACGSQKDPGVPLILSLTTIYFLLCASNCSARNGATNKKGWETLDKYLKTFYYEWKITKMFFKLTLVISNWWVLWTVPKRLKALNSKFIFLISRKILLFRSSCHKHGCI